MASIANSAGARIVVVGAGAAGLASAWQLARAGHDVTIVDRGEVGKGALWASGGMLAAGFESSVELDAGTELAQPFTDLLHASLDHWPEWISELQGFSPAPLGFNRDGSVVPLFTEADLRRADTVEAQARRLGVGLERIDGAQLSQLEPGLASAEGAVVFKGDGQLDNRALGPALAAAVFHAGGRIEMRSGVKQLLRRSGGVAGVTLADGRTLESDIVVLATGAQSLVDMPRPVETRPVKGQMLAFNIDPGAGPRHVIRGFSIYLCTKPGGRLIAGATVEPDVEDLTTTDDASDTLLQGARSVIPSLSSLAPVEQWSGLRPAAADLMPMVGEVESGLILAGGGYRNGVLLAPAMAEAVTAVIAGGELPARARPFCPNRPSLQARRDH